MNLKRLTPLSGIVFVVLVIVAFVPLGGSTPDSNATGAELASFYDEHTVRQGVAAFVLAASVPFLVAFGIGLAASVTRGAQRIVAWERALVAGTIVAGAATLVMAFAHFALVDAADQKLSPAALEALNALDSNSWIAFNGALGVMMLGAAGLLLSARVLRGLAWTALALGIGLFVPFADFVAMGLSGVWVLGAGLAIGRGERNARRAPAVPAV